MQWKSSGRRYSKHSLTQIQKSTKQQSSVSKKSDSPGQWASIFLCSSCLRAGSRKLDVIKFKNSQSFNHEVISGGYLSPL